MLPRQQWWRQPPSLGLIAQPLALLWPTPQPPPEPAAPQQESQPAEEGLRNMPLTPQENRLREKSRSKR